MPDLSILTSAGPYHILSYGTLFGMTVFQSFINGIVSYRALPRQHFGNLQEKLTPIYFRLQTLLPAVLAVTYPGVQAVSPLRGQLEASGPAGVFLDERNRWGVLVPIVGMFVCNAANAVWLGPVTTQIMHKRRQQETKEGKKSWDAGPQSAEMQALNKEFGMMHGMSALVNMFGMGFMVWYGFTLGLRL